MRVLQFGQFARQLSCLRKRGVPCGGHRYGRLHRDRQGHGPELERAESPLRDRAPPGRQSHGAATGSMCQGRGTGGGSDLTGRAGIGLDLNPCRIDSLPFCCPALERNKGFSTRQAIDPKALSVKRCNVGDRKILSRAHKGGVSEIHGKVWVLFHNLKR